MGERINIPELAESKDERIRKQLVEIVKRLGSGIIEIPKNIADIFAWLEKQKEQKPEKLNDDTEVGLDRALQIIKDAKGNLCGYQSDDGIYECEHAIQTLNRILKNGIEQKPASISCGHANDKPAEWSEEDVNRIGSIRATLEHDVYRDEQYKDIVDTHKRDITWLDNLYQTGCCNNNSEWSEEDEAHLNWLCRIIHSKKNEGTISLKEESELGKWIDKWINHSLQPHWKPSKEQMNELFQTLIPGRDYDCDVLQGLHDDLVKLMEGKL